MVAISEVPTIAAVIAATIFGSTPSGRVCVTTSPSRRTTAADLMSVTWESSSIVSSRRPQRSARGPLLGQEDPGERLDGPAPAEMEETHGRRVAHTRQAE